MVYTERLYLEKLAKENSRATKNGWPDFLVTPKNEGAYFVEVKQLYQTISKAQRTMFEALETSTGFKVYIWTPKQENELIPWREWPEKRRAMKIAS